MWIDTTKTVFVHHPEIACQYAITTRNDLWVDHVGNEYAFPPSAIDPELISEYGITSCLFVAARDNVRAFSNLLSFLMRHQEKIRWSAWLNKREVVIALSDTIRAQEVKAWKWDKEDWFGRELARVAGSLFRDSNGTSVVGNVYALPCDEESDLLAQKFGGAHRAALVLEFDNQGLFYGMVNVLEKTTIEWCGWAFDRKMLILQGKYAG